MQIITENFVDEGPFPHVHDVLGNADRGLSTEILSIKPQQYLQDQLDVFNILSSFPGLTSTLDNLNLGENVRSPLLNEVLRRDKYLDVRSGFWNMVRTDLPWQLNEGANASIDDTDILTNPPALSISAQMLARHPKYKGGVLVKSPLRCLHRTDGK